MAEARAFTVEAFVHLFMQLVWKKCSDRLVFMSASLLNLRGALKPTRSRRSRDVELQIEAQGLIVFNDV